MIARAGVGFVQRHRALGLALSLVALKWVVEAVRLDFGGVRGFLGASDVRFDVFFFAPALALLCELALLLPRAVRVGALAAVGLVGSLVIIADLVTLQYFRENILVIVPLLMRNGTAAAVSGNEFLFVTPGFVALVVLAAVLASVTWSWRINRVSLRWSFAYYALSIMGFLWTEAHDSLFQASLTALTDGSIYYRDEEADGAAVPDKPLRGGSHLEPQLAPAAALAPKTIVVFINESLPWSFGSSTDLSRPLISTLLTEGGIGEGEWTVFPHAFTNSSATDISVPSILTGVDSTAGTDAVQRMPFVYSLAKARGYRTAFFTPQDYSWFNLRLFFTSEHLDAFVSGEMTGQPSANLMGIDDMYVAGKVADYILSQPREQPLFLVINNNALHVPYQTASQIPVPDFGGDAKRKAAYILEAYYGRVYAALRQSGRLAGSLFVVTSDHGEAHPNRPRKNARLDSHFDEVINIPLAIRLPAGSSAALKQALDQNLGRTVENLDIAPSLSWLLGALPPPAAPYGGRSLFEPLPGDRVSISVTNNEWKQWTPKAFGLARGNDRLVYSDRVGLQYYDVAADPDEAHPITSGVAYDLYTAIVRRHPTLPAYLTHDRAP